MAFTNSVVFSVEVPVVVDSVVIGSDVAGGAVDAKYAANVEGTELETIGITVYGVVANSLCLE